jgi:hypothetical protein
MGEEKAPFNSALDLLERLSDILKYMTRVRQNVYLSKSKKQEYILDLLKDYYKQAIPLLSADGRENFRSVLKLKQEIKIVAQPDRSKIKRAIYSEELEDEMDDYLIKIQIDLQDIGKYFMPPRRKLSSVVSDFSK